VKDLMIDIETLSSDSDAVMIQLAGVYFDRQTGETGAEYCRNISRESCLDLGFKESQSTIDWWAKQDPDVLASIKENPCTAQEAMREFSDFVHAVNGVSVWSHATFDFVIVQNYLTRLDLRPMPYRSARDIRTLVDLSGIDLKSYDWKKGKTHHALDDCKFQITYCVDALNTLRG
jgi:hypothetical protein